MVENYFETYFNNKEDVDNKYLSPDYVAEIIHQEKYAHEVIGKTIENRSIYLLKKGRGSIKGLFWAQMHGNETTASRAMFDIWKVLHAEELNKEILDKVQIHFIPQLNPDGAAAYQRENADGLDINRDFNARKTIEMRVLQELVQKENYDFLFNLHDQRTIFHPNNINKPATLSFLAPVVDNQGSIPPNRLKAMQVISQVVDSLQPILTNQLAKFSDEYYPEATGDNFQRLGYPTILVECGHFPNDYDRNITRKYTFYALLKAIEIIMQKSYIGNNCSSYQNLPENDNKAFDILYKDVLIMDDDLEKTIDLGIQYTEVLENDKIIYEARIKSIGDLSNYFGHDICHAENRVFKNNSDTLPNIGDLANFYLSELKIQNGKVINNSM